MNVEFTKTFSKQIDAILNKSLLDKISKIVEQVISASTMQ
jgi:hypothetical protein